MRGLCIAGVALAMGCLPQDLPTGGVEPAVVGLELSVGAETLAAAGSTWVAVSATFDDGSELDVTDQVAWRYDADVILVDEFEVWGLDAGASRLRASWEGLLTERLIVWVEEVEEKPPVVGKPDLQVALLSSAPDWAGNVEFGFRSLNAGVAASPSSSVVVEVYDADWSYVAGSPPLRVGELGPGEEWVQSVWVELAYGEYQVYLYADVHDEVAESDESNNIEAWSFDYTFE